MSRTIYDAEASVVLQADGAAAITATAQTTPIDFSWGFNNGFALVINVTDIDAVTGDETYTFAVQSTDSAGANPVNQVTIPSIGATGQYVIPLLGDTALQFDADAAQIALNCTIAGTTPSITFSAWLNPAYGFEGPA